LIYCEQPACRGFCGGLEFAPSPAVMILDGWSSASAFRASIDGLACSTAPTSVAAGGRSRVTRQLRRLKFGFVTAVLFAIQSSAAVAQERPGVLVVTVRDSSGAAIPGATIRIVNAENRAVAEIVSDAHGSGRADALAPGEYRIEAGIDGFDPVVSPIAIVRGEPVEISLTLNPSRYSESVVVTARRVEEAVQEVPIPVSVVSAKLAADSGAFNVNRAKELIPTLQFYSSNPRNSAITIRGLGSPFGLANDGIDPGVGFYIDGVFYARPAAATLDFVDLERMEVLRGPQGTLYGKNTTAGAINLTTRKPTFTRESDVELTWGSLDLVQAKASVAGGLSDTLAGRLSFSGTTRHGAVTDVTTGDNLNGLNNLGFRGQLLYTPSSHTAITVAGDHTRQRPRGYAQVVAGVAPTLRAADRQFASIAADLGYRPASFNGFDRVTDADTAHRSNQDLGGAALTIDRDAGSGRMTSITAWRYWNWDASSDRDFIGLPVTTISASPSRQRQWTQEIRYSRDVSPRLGFAVGAFAFHQKIRSTGRQEQGAAAARFLLAPGALAATPGLLDRYGQTSDVRSTGTTVATFGQIEWTVTERVRILPGLRFNYDEKHVDYRSDVYGGLQTADPALIALQRSVLAPQAYEAGAHSGNVSGQLTAAIQARPGVNLFATYATSYKPVGLNLSGLPTDASGQPALALATVEPEDERHIEVGLKTEPWRGATANLAVYDTAIEHYQANVVNAQVGVLRGYLANAGKVRVRGAEFDGSTRVHANLSLYGSMAYTDAVYASFPDAPPPLEETGGARAKDISGSVLPGISKWAMAVGGEYTHPTSAFSHAAEFFLGVDASSRSSFSSSATASRYLIVQGYSLVNLRFGLRWSNAWSLSVWSRNLLDQDYFELLSAAPGGSGLYVGLPGDPRTVGVTLRMGLRSR
jgi:iron complex outermembrane receptor protein